MDATFKKTKQDDNKNKKNVNHSKELCRGYKLFQKNLLPKEDLLVLFQAARKEQQKRLIDIRKKNILRLVEQL